MTLVSLNRLVIRYRQSSCAPTQETGLWHIHESTWNWPVKKSLTNPGYCTDFCLCEPRASLTWRKWSSSPIAEHLLGISCCNGRLQMWISTSRGAAIVKRNAGQMSPADVHLPHEGAFSSEGWIWEEWVQKPVFCCQGDGTLMTPGNSRCYLTVQEVFDSVHTEFLQSPRSSWGLVTLFRWRWHFIIVSCLLESCTAQMIFGFSR